MKRGLVVQPGGLRLDVGHLRDAGEDQLVGAELEHGLGGLADRVLLPGAVLEIVDVAPDLLAADLGHQRLEHALLEVVGVHAGEGPGIDAVGFDGGRECHQLVPGAGHLPALVGEQGGVVPDRPGVLRGVEADELVADGARLAHARIEALLDRDRGIVPTGCGHQIIETRELLIRGQRVYVQGAGAGVLEQVWGRLVHELRLQGAEILGTHNFRGHLGPLFLEELLGEVQVLHPVTSVEDESGELSAVNPERIVLAGGGAGRLGVGASVRAAGGTGGEAGSAQGRSEAEEGPPRGGVRCGTSGSDVSAESGHEGLSRRS